MSRRLILPWCLLFFGQSLAAQSIHIGVLGIFHPRRIVVTPAPSETLLLSASGQQVPFGAAQAHASLKVSAVGGKLRVESGSNSMVADRLSITSRNGDAASFVLTIPGKITRRYLGTLELRAQNSEVLPVVTMDLETAVASAVQAESAPNTPDEALKAQAVVSRSYYRAGESRHDAFDFCDLAHCQVLRDPPADSPASRAAAATKGLVLQYDARTIAAMFTRSCAGRTLAAAQIGLTSSRYPYYSVVCDFCSRNPIRWTRVLTHEDAALLLKNGEAGRLEVVRRLGWSAVPGNSFTTEPDGDRVILHGKGEGHGLGYCQRGAAALARAGSGFHEILSHYFPNTSLAQLPTH